LRGESGASEVEVIVLVKPEGKNEYLQVTERGERGSDKKPATNDSNKNEQEGEEDEPRLRGMEHELLIDGVAVVPGDRDRGDGQVLLARLRNAVIQNLQEIDVFLGVHTDRPEGRGEENDESEVNK
jgi:hypothetical protein